MSTAGETSSCPTKARKLRCFIAATEGVAGSENAANQKEKLFDNSLNNTGRNSNGVLE